MQLVLYLSFIPPSNCFASAFPSRKIDIINAIHSTVITTLPTQPDFSLISTSDNHKRH